ncbi:Mu transposase C-terminal domain-containing protein [Intestinirhabdus alba]|jgi:putative transposase|uniref:DDE-type integrase/transposase/recombinase n=1 Tax=Intestinirhabdus alba TaxID=2899544 RepID=A0A6L6IRR6_9ENTR|nr:Mu transposase C-terminal domain-containing protein [Intestinirhabdus alba]MTH47503.1 DDE-type integrase/transposase/recombinase [Intestinirhabdus alba]
MNIWLTAKESVGLPGLPGTEHNIRNSLNKRAGENELLRRRRSGTKAFEYHVDCLPAEAQEVIRQRHYSELLEQSATAEPAAVPAAKNTIKPRNKLALIRQCPALLEREVSTLTDKQRQISDARAVLAQTVVTMCQSGVSRAAAVRQIVSASRDGSLPLSLRQAAEIASARKGQRCGIGKSSLQEWVSIYMATENSAERLKMLAPGHHKSRAPEQIGWLPRFLAHWRNLNGPSLQAAYNSFRDEWEADYADQPAMQAACPSYHAVRRAMEKLPRRERARGRVSASAARALETYVKRDWSMMPVNGCWVSDGKSLNMKVAHPIHGRPFTPELTMVIDGRSRVVVGWSLALSENVIAVADAYRHAMSRFGKPLFTYSDNGGGEKNKTLDADITGIFPRLGIQHMTGIPGNPQARGIIERLNAVIPRSVAIKFGTYNGYGADRENVRITSRAINSAINALEKNKELNPVQRNALAKLPSWQQLLDVIEEEVEKYNNTHRHSSLPKVDGRHMTPMEAYRAALKEGGDEIEYLSVVELRDMFMPEQVRKARRGWLDLQNNSYFSEQLLAVDGEDVRVAYDIHDATRVVVRRMDGSFVCEAIWNGNTRAAVPVPAVQTAMEQRRQRRLNLNDQKRREIEAEGRPVLEAPTLPDFNFGQVLQGELQQAEQQNYHFLEADREHHQKTGTWDRK